MNRRWRWVAVGTATLLVVAVIGLAGIIVLIRSGLQRYSNEAMARFPGDRTQALIAMVECDTCSLEDRNHAVWALGQMVAEPALGTLRKHYDGQQCTHEARLCQYELRKAIRMIETHTAGTGPVWRLVGRLHQPWY